MSRKQKLIAKLKNRPKDFTWSELTTLLVALGYRELKGGRTGGSRRRFAHESAAMISLHQPHPQKELKAYQVDLVLQTLIQEELI